MGSGLGCVGGVSEIVCVVQGSEEKKVRESQVCGSESCGRAPGSQVWECTRESRVCRSQVWQGVGELGAKSMFGGVLGICHH